MSDKDTISGLAIGFILGAAVGLAVGILYAPRPGEETRELLKEKAEVARVKAVEAIEKVKETATSARKRAQEKLSQPEE